MVLLFVVGCTEDSNSPPLRQVSISFDDDLAIDAAYEHRYLFERYDATFTLYVSKLPKVTPEQIEKLLTLQDESYEIGSHSLWHKAATSMPIDTYMSTEVIPSVNNMRALGLDVTTFAYPFGSRNAETDAAILKVVDRVRGFSTDGNVAPSSGNSIMAYSIDQYHLDMNKVFDAMDNLEDGQTLYLTTHVIGDWINGWSISTQDLETILNYGQSTGITFCTVREC